MGRITKRDEGILSLLGKGMPEAEVCRSLGINVVQVEESLERIDQTIESGRADEKLQALYERAVRRRLENALRAQQIRFSALLDSVLSAVLVIDGRTGVVKQANSKAEELFAYGRGSLVGILVEDLVPPQHQVIHPAYRIGFLNSIRKREMGYHPPIFARRADGRQIELAIALTATRLDDDVMVVCTEYSVWVEAGKDRTQERSI
ncbi:MAG TPA: PAS domain-containing protein [Fimbriimonadaceae bacterium]|nr:PAS domain-containing protein [Fimbriimonadaceae bacterium]